MFCRSLEEFRVLTDALDDPDRRWFIAHELSEYIGWGNRHYGLPLVPREDMLRVLDVLGVKRPDEKVEEQALRDQVQSALSVVYFDFRTVRRVESQPPPGGEEIQPAWTYRHCVFTSESAAVAYKEHCDRAAKLPPLESDVDLLMANNMPGLP
jgi:hypothetical protein